MKNSLGNGTGSINDRLAMLGYRSYAEYLSGGHWSDVRRRFYRSRLVRRDSDGRPACAICGVVGALHLHHRTYKTLGCENLNHLILLCATHHDEVHRLHLAGLPLWAATKRAGKSLRSSTSRRDRTTARIESDKKSSRDRFARRRG